MFYFIFLLLITAQGEYNIEMNPNLDEATKNIQELLIDGETNQILFIQINVFRDIIQFQVLAEQKNSSYAIYAIKLINILQNNVLDPNYEIQYLQYYIPQKEEKCLTLIFLDPNNVCIFCVKQQQLIIHSFGNLEGQKIINLNYKEFLNTIEIKVESTILSVYLNIHQSNWQIQVFSFDLQMTESFKDEWIPIIYGPKIFKYDNEFLIKKAYLEYSMLLIITVNNRLYRLLLQTESLNKELNLNNTSTLLDIDIANDTKNLFLLTKINDICQVNKLNNFKSMSVVVSNINCYSNQLSLMVMDQEKFFLIENNTAIISLSSNATYPLNQQYWILIPSFKLLLNYGNSSSIFAIYLGQPFNSNLKKNQIDYDQGIDYDYDYDYEFDNQFLFQKHPIFFGKQEYETFSLTPFLYGPPFSVVVLEDQFKLITTIDLPQHSNICLKNIQYEFVKMITESQIIYQHMKEVYYLQCNSDKISKLLLIRKNEQAILFFSSLILTQNDFFIYFDDMDGNKFFIYEITGQQGLSESSVIFMQQQVFQSPIKYIGQLLNGITLHHVDQSKTLLSQFGFQKFNQQRFTTLGFCDQILNLNLYLLCSFNTIQDGLLVFFLNRNKFVYQVNRYTIQNNFIQDLIMLQEDQLILILKNTLNFEITLQHYQIQGEKVELLRQLPTYEYRPQRFMEIQKTIVIVLALNEQGDPFLMSYDITQQKQQCLLKLIPYNNNRFCISAQSIDVLQYIVNINNQSEWKLQKYRFQQNLLGIRQIQQPQFKKQYSVILQVNNHIIQRNIELHFTGLDFTSQLIQLKQDIAIFPNDGFQKIYFNEFIYGPIHQVMCLKNCSFSHPIAIIKNISQKRLGVFQMKFPIIIDNSLFCLHQRKFYMIQLLNIEHNDFQELTFLSSTNNSRSQIAFKLIDSNLQEPLALISFLGDINCYLQINVYLLQEQLEISQQEIPDPPQKFCSKINQIKIRQNIFVLVDINQLILYQYNSISKIFEKQLIKYQINATLISQDHFVRNNLLYFIAVTDKDNILLIIDLYTQSIICESFYQAKKEILSALILDASENIITILYMRKIYPIIQHIYIVDNRVDNINTQELAVDPSMVLQMPIYFDNNKVIFRILNFTQMQNSEFFSLQYQISSEKQKYIFPSQIYGSMDYLLKKGNNSYIFINQTSIGEISIFDSYEIQLSGNEIDIQVSNEKKMLILTLRALKYSNNRIDQIGVLGISIVILIVFLWKQKPRENKLDI